jgi:hypothetical protein
MKRRDCLKWVAASVLSLWIGRVPEVPDPPWWDTLPPLTIEEAAQICAQALGAGGDVRWSMNTKEFRIDVVV